MIFSQENRNLILAISLSAYQTCLNLKLVSHYWCVAHLRYHKIQEDIYTSNFRRALIPPVWCITVTHTKWSTLKQFLPCSYSVHQFAAKLWLSSSVNLEYDLCLCDCLGLSVYFAAKFGPGAQNGALLFAFPPRYLICLHTNLRLFHILQFQITISRILCTIFLIKQMICTNCTIQTFSLQVLNVNQINVCNLSLENNNLLHCTIV